MADYEITPTVNQVHTFIEIANDFENCLDLVREAISNSFDADATEISIDFSITEEHGESILKIVLTDDGTGMDKQELKAFFDLGNSPRRGDDNKIGEKGHGTKIYFNSQKVVVKTSDGTSQRVAEMDQPMRTLHNGKIPTVKVTSPSQMNLPEMSLLPGTKITIWGYNNNQLDQFTHEIIRDYIKWFTRAGSIQWVFDSEFENPVCIYLKGLNRDEDDFEKLDPWHQFGEESPSVDALLATHSVNAPDYYCRRIVRKGNLESRPDIEYHAVFSIEGSQVKYAYNKMLSRQGRRGAYKVQDRYGLWLCKDFIPIQRKNEWLPTEKTEWTRLHAFINCQAFQLTANRGSVENTQSEILADLHKEIKKIYEDIKASDDWKMLRELDASASAHRTSERERRDFDRRRQRLNRAKVAQYKGVTLIEPQRESGVFALFLQLSILKPSLFPFEVLDYDTHQGIDVIVKGDNTTPIVHAPLFYVEFKHQLGREFNHSFDNLRSVVCWDTQVNHDETVKCLRNTERTMKIMPPRSEDDHTHYSLDDPYESHSIEVFVLKDYLKEKLGIEFRPRTRESVV